MKYRVFIGFIAVAVGAALVVGSIGFSGSIASAQSYDPDQDIPKPTLLQKRITKLGRGLGNLLWGWTEIPVTWDQKMKEGKPLSYLLSTAPVIGITKAIMRTGTGLYEIVTFPTSPEEQNFEPYIEPEYVF